MTSIRWQRCLCSPALSHPRADVCLTGREGPAVAGAEWAVLTRTGDPSVAFGLFPGCQPQDSWVHGASLNAVFAHRRSCTAGWHGSVGCSQHLSAVLALSCLCVETSPGRGVHLGPSRSRGAGVQGTAVVQQLEATRRPAGPEPPTEDGPADPGAKCSVPCDTLPPRVSGRSLGKTVCKHTW